MTCRHCIAARAAVWHGAYHHGCDECTDYADEHDGPPEFGCCLPPGECCMPGLHFPSECHTAADYERAQFGGFGGEPGEVEPGGGIGADQPVEGEVAAGLVEAVVAGADQPRDEGDQPLALLVDGVEDLAVHVLDLAHRLSA